MNDPAHKEDLTSKPASAASVACMECGSAVDADFGVPGYCFVCSVHVASCCADPLDPEA